jgi:hypothetical protein
MLASIGFLTRTVTVRPRRAGSAVQGAQTDAERRKESSRVATEDARFLFCAQERGVDNRLDARFDLIGEVRSEHDPPGEPALDESLEIPEIANAGRDRRQL